MSDSNEQATRDLVARIQAEFDFGTLADIGKPYATDIGVALPQLESRSLKLQLQGYPRFIRLWFKHLASPFGPSQEECEALMRRISDRRSVNMITYVCRMHLRRETPVSWRKVAERGYDVSNASFPKTISEKLKSSSEALTKLGIFDIDSSLRVVGGLPEVSRYYISAGTTLVAFERHVWRQLRTRQLVEFAQQHLMDDLAGG